MISIQQTKFLECKRASFDSYCTKISFQRWKKKGLCWSRQWLFCWNMKPWHKTFKMYRWDFGFSANENGLMKTTALKVEPSSTFSKSLVISATYFTYLSTKVNSFSKVFRANNEICSSFTYGISLLWLRQLVYVFHKKYFRW